MKLLLSLICLFVGLFPFQGFSAPLRTQVSSIKAVQASPTSNNSKDITGKLTKETSKTEKAPEKKPTPILVLPPPVSKQFLNTPAIANFRKVSSQAGKYQLQVPISFGSNPFESLSGLDDIALFHTDGTKLFATNVLDHSDAVHYRPTQVLPTFPDSKLQLVWQFPSQGGQLWTCKLLNVNDFQGNRCILQASTKISGLTYEMLFLVPKKEFYTAIPEILYSINSFSL